jgi:hypothetical protein
MSGKTAGQAAYEAGVRVMLDGDIAADRVPDEGPDFAWDAIGSLERDSWEAAAQAVLNDAFPGLREQVRLAREDRDQLRKQVLDLAADLDGRCATRPPGRSHTEHEIAIALRKIAGPPS